MPEACSKGGEGRQSPGFRLALGSQTEGLFGNWSIGAAGQDGISLDSEDFRGEKAAMNLDEGWLDDAQIAALSARSPASAWGQELMQAAWPRLYTSLLSSETYRGCVMALSLLCTQVRPGFALGEVEQLITTLHEAVATAETLPAGSDRAGGFGLVITNAWERAHAGLATGQLIEAFESEMIYTARLFVTAREKEKSGSRLP